VRRRRRRVHHVEQGLCEVRELRREEPRQGGRVPSSAATRSARRDPSPTTRRRTTARTTYPRPPTARASTTRPPAMRARSTRTARPVWTRPRVPTSSTPSRGSSTATTTRGERRQRGIDLPGGRDDP